MLVVWCATKNCLFVFVIVVFNLSHFSHGLTQSTYAVFSPFASCDTRHKRTSVTHVIFYLHFILNVSYILALCRYIVINLMRYYLAKTVCLSLLELFQISFRHFVVLKLSFGNILKLQQSSEFRLFLFKYEAGFKISVLVSITVALQCPVMFSGATWRLLLY